MTLRRSALLVMACLGLLGTRLALASPVQYTLTPIRVPGSDRTYALAINERGQVTGYAEMPDRTMVSYVFSAGAFTYPDTLGAQVIFARDINDDGDIVGTYNLPSDPFDFNRAFAWIAGVTTDLGNLGSGEAEATVIDKRGIVYGQSVNAFAWRNGHLRDLGGWPGYDVTTITGVNDAGVAVGYAVHYGVRTIAFMADRDSRTQLPTLGGGSARASGINDQGAICGWAELATGKIHAFRYQDGAMSDLGILAGGVHSEAQAINHAGDVVGGASSTRGERAFLVRGGTSQMQDLNELADAHAQGWRLQEAHDINDRGEIVGWGNRGGFLLTPVPEATPARDAAPARRE